MGVFPAPTTGGGGGAPTGPAGGDLGGNYPNPTTPVANAAAAAASAAVAAEAITRAGADTTLTTNLGNEVTNRTNADTTLQTNITNEATTRSGADTTLQTNITNEGVTRAGADTTLQTNITNEANARIAADALLAPLDAAVSNKTAAYTFVLADDGAILTMNGAFNFTVPLHATQAFPVGATLECIRIGAGAVSIVATGGVTINSRGGLLGIKDQWSSVVLVQIANDSWVLEGNLA